MTTNKTQRYYTPTLRVLQKIIGSVVSQREHVINKFSN